jgi:hypothetical protein
MGNLSIFLVIRQSGVQPKRTTMKAVDFSSVVADPDWAAVLIPETEELIEATLNGVCVPKAERRPAHRRQLPPSHSISTESRDST